MASPSVRRDLKALHRLISQTDQILASIPDPHPSIPAARESLIAALALSKDLIKRSMATSATSEAASALGSKGGQRTAERGPEYFKKIASMRKTRAGGRPRRKQDH